jgi:hypothetical protein
MVGQAEGKFREAEMGFRMRKSMKIAPGVRLSVGRAGAERVAAVLAG